MLPALEKLADLERFGGGLFDFLTADVSPIQPAES